MMIKILTFYLCLLSIQFITAAECEVPTTNTFTIRISSNVRVEILDSQGNYVSQAVLCQYDGGWTTIDYASWIWNAEYASDDQYMYFRVKFPIYGTPTSGSLEVAVDNSVTVYSDGNNIDCSESTYDYSQVCDVLSYLKSGINIFTFTAYNGDGPGGLVFRFDIEASF